MNRSTRWGFGFAVAAILALAACTTEKVVYLTPEEAKDRQAKINADFEARSSEVRSKLPPGCTFHDLGTFKRQSYSDVPIFAVVCGKTTTTGWSYQFGKYTNHAALVTVVE